MGYVIGYKNPRSGEFEPVSDKGHFLEDGKKSIPLRFYKSKGYCKKKIDQFVNLAFDAVVRVKNKQERMFLEHTAYDEILKMYAQHRVSELRMFIMIKMLEADGDTIRDEETCKRDAYKDFIILSFGRDLHLDDNEETSILDDACEEDEEDEEED